MSQYTNLDIVNSISVNEGRVETIVGPGSFTHVNCSPCQAALILTIYCILLPCQAGGANSKVTRTSYGFIVRKKGL